MCVGMPRAFLRPDAVAWLRRWREALAGAAAMALGLYWGATAFGIVAWLGAVLALAGLALAIAGWQRGRFRQPGDGPGVVVVDEGRLTYFGSETGGTLAVREIRRLSVVPRRGAPVWQVDTEAERLEIPVNAAGAEALFDVFTQLPGIDTTAVLDAATRASSGPVTVWAAPRRQIE